MRTSQILLISGSTRAGSTNSATVATALAVAPAIVTASIYDGLTELPAFVPGDGPPPAAVADLRAQLAQADAVVFCTPEYAGTLPGSFKNLLDWTVGTGDLWRKPVAWINVAAPGRGDGAISTLATVLRYVEAAVIEPACVRIPVPREALSADGAINDAEIRSQLAACLQTVATSLTTADVGQP